MRNNNHLKFVRSLPCCSCLSQPAEAAHIRKGTNGGMGMKPSDNNVVPLCHKCHSEQHRIGEVSFWHDMNHPIELANALWLMTGDKERAVHRIIGFRRVFQNNKRTSKK